jgi:hypothetical protein
MAPRKRAEILMGRWDRVLLKIRIEPQRHKEHGGQPRKAARGGQAFLIAVLKRTVIPEAEINRNKKSLTL